MNHSVEVSKLKSLVSSVCNKVSQPAAPTAETSPPPQVPSSHSAPPPATSHHRPSLANNNKVNSVQDRKFNVVVFGVQEMLSGSSRFARDKHDFSKLSVIFSDLEHDTDHSSSIRVCRHLGKYVKGVSSSRPLLVTLNSMADVRSILLSHNNSSDTSISIKPDLPSEERKANAILLRPFQT